MEKVKQKNNLTKEMKNAQGKTSILIILIIAILIFVINAFLKKNGTSTVNTILEQKTSTENEILEEKQIIENAILEEKPPTTNAIAEQYGIEQIKNKTITDENNNPIITIPAGYILANPNKNKDINYKDSKNPKVEEGIVITDKINKDGKSIGNEFVWVPVPDVNEIYDSEAKRSKLHNFIEYKEGKVIVRTPPKLVTYSSTNIREPDLLKRYDNDNEPYLSGIKLTSKEFEKELKDEYKKTISSIDTYKGFYIGRYETGGLKSGTITKAVVKKERSDINYANWYYIYASSKNIKKEGSSAISSMIWGCQWDAVMTWFLNCGGETAEYVINSDKKGYYNKQEPTLTGYYQVNNIYDMAGNVSEWTIEAFDIMYRVFRGGNYYNSGSSQPASYRSFQNPNNGIMSALGSRSALYIKNKF